MTEILDATRDLADLARLAGRPSELGDVLRRALDALHRMVPHDLAAVLALEGDELRVVAARGALADERVRGHRLELGAYPTIRRALESRRPRILEEDHHASGEGDPYDGVLDLPHGHSCMIVPLYTADRPLGLITFDMAVCGSYDETTLGLVDAFGQVLSLAFIHAEQAELLQRYRERLDERHRVMEQDGGGGCRAAERLEASADAGMRRLADQARQVARTDAPVLIRGETGTGKEVLAQALHCWSPRAAQPFLKLNCAAIPETLIESELFGHVKGAFSGADTARPGRFLAANGGTLLLDEIGDMPLAAQAKLLRVLQEGAFEPVGSDRTVIVDVRILAATHRDLAAEVAAGRFREDLFYRLDVFPLALPPLRSRPADLVPLAASILDDIWRRTGRGPWTLGPDAAAALRAQDWPGNVRQLVNTLERATILRPEGRLSAADVAGTPAAAPRPPVRAAEEPDVRETLESVERRHIAAVLEAVDGRIYGEDGAAARLGLKPTTLQSRLRRLGIDRLNPSG